MAHDLFAPAAPMRIDATDPNDDLVGNHFVERGPADVALFGLPYDGAVIGRKGARLGPAAIRAQLRKLKSDRPARWLDLGDARMPDDPIAAGDVATRAMEAALATGAFPVALGGDHSLTYGLVRAAARKHPDLTVVNLDAHLDVREAKIPNSGTSFRRLVDDAIVPGARIHEVGIRPHANSPRYLTWAKAAGIRVVTADEATPADLSRLSGPIYLSLDIDVLDETAAPGVSAPTPGGWTSAHLFRMLRTLRREDVVAMDVVEMSPPLDQDDRTARAAAWSILTMVAR